MAIQLVHPAPGEGLGLTWRLPAELTGHDLDGGGPIGAVLLAAKRLEEASREEVAVAVVHGHGRAAASETELEADQRRDLVAQTVLVEREQQVDVQQQPPEEIALQPDRPLKAL